MAKRTASPESTFGHAFGVGRTASDDWFDPTLHADTDLFVDPFLMFTETADPWASVQDRLIDFFNTALEHVAAAAGNRTSIEWRRAAAMFSFPEPAEFCLGYGQKTIFGSGSGGGLGEAMLEAAVQAIQLGVRNITDFGELLLFGEGFGADRVGDMVCNVVKDDFARYTIDVATRHGLAQSTVKLRHAGFDFGTDRWRTWRVSLPINPCWKPNIPVLLVPDRFLSELPKMDDQQFWDWVYENQNQQLRQDLGYTITKGLKKKEIIALAKQRFYLRRRYGVQYAEASRNAPPKPYDFGRDPKFKVTGFSAGEEVATISRVAEPSDASAFCEFVKTLATEFQWAVEQRGIWKAFWAGGSAFREDQVQRLFHIAVLLTCKARNIDVSPEADAGQGPVDFKFSAGWTKRSLVELKFAKSSSFWNNLEKQTPAYLSAEQIECGYIVVIQHEDRHCKPEFTDRVKKIVDRVSADTGYTYEAIFVDARPRASASKLKRGP
jgi:hypothetical protein